MDSKATMTDVLIGTKFGHRDTETKGRQSRDDRERLDRGIYKPRTPKNCHSHQKLGEVRKGCPIDTEGTWELTVILDF
jgi:hypothetical protein